MSIDPMADKYPAWNPYHYVHNNPVRLVDPTGMGAEDWVQRGNGEIYWDDNATSQSTTISGETYLGKGGFSTVSSSGLQTNYNSDKTFDHFNTGGNILPQVTIFGTRQKQKFSLGPLNIEFEGKVSSSIDLGIVYKRDKGASGITIKGPTIRALEMSYSTSKGVTGYYMGKNGEFNPHYSQHYY